MQIIEKDLHTVQDIETVQVWNKIQHYKQDFYCITYISMKLVKIIVETDFKHRFTVNILTRIYTFTYM